MFSQVDVGHKLAHSELSHLLNNDPTVWQIPSIGHQVHVWTGTEPSAAACIHPKQLLLNWLQ